MSTEDMLKSKFEKFKNINVKVQDARDSNCGLLLERLLGSSGGDLNVPDFYDIEIKAIRSYFYDYFTLFTCHATGNHEFHIEYISENFGVPDKDYPGIKGIRGSIGVGYFKRIGEYLYKLYIDKLQERLILEIYDLRYNVVDCSTYWDFDDLKEMLERKLKKLALFQVEKYRHESIYFKYTSYTLYYLKTFEDFIDCIEKGYIYITINTGARKSYYKPGTFIDHGTAFKIDTKYIEYLFDKIETV